MLRLDVVGRHLRTLDPVKPVPTVLLHAHDVKADDEELLLLTQFADVGLRQLDDDAVVLFGDVEPVLRIEEERLGVVKAPTGPFAGRVPRAGHLFLAPRLGKGEQGGVDQPTDGQLGKLMQKIVKRHPGNMRNNFY